MNAEEHCPEPAAPLICDDSLSVRVNSMTKKFNRNLMVSIITLAILVAVILMFRLYFEAMSVGMMGLGVVIGGICLVAGAITGTAAHWYHKEINRLAGPAITREELGNVFEVGLFHPDDYINELKCRAARMRLDWDRMTGSGYFSGTYQGVGFEFSNIRLIRVNMSVDLITYLIERDESSDIITSPKRVDKPSDLKGEKTIFLGPWLIVNLAVPVQSPVVISARSEVASRLITALTPGATSGMEDIKTENAAFNQKFMVKAFDIQTAFYVLTPPVIEYIMEVDKMVGGYKHFCFERNYMHVVLDTGYESFLIRNEATDIPALRARIQNEVRSLAGFMDMLFLNDRLFER